MRAPPARGVQVAAAQGAPAPARARAGALGRGGNAAMWLPGRRGSGPSFAGRSRAGLRRSMTSASVVAGASLVLAGASPDRPVLDGLDAGCRGEDGCSGGGGSLADRRISPCSPPAGPLMTSAPACWWARTELESMLNVHSTLPTGSSLTMTWSRMGFQVPSFVQIRSRSCAIFQGPQRSGRWRAGAPVRSFHRIALITWRWSRHRRPPLSIGGSSGSIRAQALSVSSPRPTTWA